MSNFTVLPEDERWKTEQGIVNTGNRVQMYL